MAIKTKLDVAWSTNTAMGAVFEVRAQAEMIYGELQTILAHINKITSGASFSAIDSEIKDEGVAIIGILNQSKKALDAHKDFLNWRQP